ncbi:uncharacterized protein LOC121806312 [Salvia splendens]|uniref:uncharacterized protein LOC121806312 n=1 Tax=Salvia splendens TaxID=180675 RepID=UPI001C26BF3E|nr:uncharacterized protein LOC121806312 [Salvia splendens]
MDMLANQLSQIVTSFSKMRGNEGRIPASVKPPDRANISQVTLRLGRGYGGPSVEKNEGPTPTSLGKETEKEETGTWEAETGEIRTEDDDQEKNGEKTVPQEADQHFSGPGVEVEIEEIRREAGESSKGDSSNKERQLPVFSKFIKEFIAGKTKPSGKIVIGETVSAVIQKRRMPSKRTDPGVSINVLPLSLYKKLEGVRMVDTKMGEYHSAKSSGVLLGRPFLRTAKTIIDVSDGTICLDYHGKKFTLNIDEAMQKPLDIENMHAVDMINPLVQEFLETELMHEHVENSELSHSIDKEVANWSSVVNTLGMTDEELAEAIMEFCKSPESVGSKGSACIAKMENLHEPEGLITKEVKKNPLPQDTSSAKKQLKTLPPGLRYAYLEENERFLVIINNNLTRKQEEELLEVLRRNKTIIGWTLSDLVGISPDLCMHHIRLEEGAKPHRDPQRKLKPNMREEVLKEVLKLLSLGIIYSIPDSKWIFMDDFTVYGNSFEACLANLDLVLQRCRKKNLVLNFEKRHFMVHEGIVLGHVVSKKGIQVYKAKVDVISRLPYPTNQKEIRGFLGHAGFYRRFIKDFAKIAQPLTRLLQNDVDFNFDEACQEAFQLLKERFVSAPIIRAPDWNYPFELMCDASDYAVGAVLSQRIEGKNYVIFYASKTLNQAQKNYDTTEKEMLAVVYSFEKFRPYLLGWKVIVFTDQAAIKYLLAKKESKPQLISNK